MPRKILQTLYSTLSGIIIGLNMSVEAVLTTCQAFSPWYLFFVMNLQVPGRSAIRGRFTLDMSQIMLGPETLLLLSMVSQANLLSAK